MGGWPSKSGPERPDRVSDFCHFPFQPDELVNHVVRIAETWLTSVERLMDVFELIRFEGFIIKGSDLKINELVSLYCYS